MKEHPPDREARLARTLVELADSLVDDFDVVDLLTLLADCCVEVLEVSEAGLMLAAPEGDLRVVASSSEAVRVLELSELQSDEGPCPECYRTARPVMSLDLDADERRWPRFVPLARAAGFRSVTALPLRLRGTVIGAMNLFRTAEGGLDEADVLAAQAFADIATIAVLQHRAAIEAHVLNEQLRHALDSRIAIEQAKGIVAARAGVDMDQAFARLRSFARNQNRRLADVARDVINGALTSQLLDQPRASHRR